MDKTSCIIGAVLATIAALAGAAPVSAQPLRITVTDPGVIQPPPVEPPLLAPPSGRFVQPSTLFDYHLDFGGNFDPAKAAMNAQFYSRPSPAVHAARAAVLDRNGESIAEHQLRCQALYPTYEPVSDTYFGPDGIPRYCIN